MWFFSLLVSTTFRLYVDVESLQDLWCRGHLQKPKNWFKYKPRAGLVKGTSWVKYFKFT